MLSYFVNYTHLSNYCRVICIFASCILGWQSNMCCTVVRSIYLVLTFVVWIYLNEIDITYITSRILVMSFPGEGLQGAVRNNIDDVRAFLESRHPGRYALYNLTLSTYRHEKFHNRVSDCGWPAKKSPNLNSFEEHILCCWYFLITSISKVLYLTRWCLIFDSSPLLQFSKYTNFTWL